MKCAACGSDVDASQVTWTQGSSVCPKCAGKGRVIARVMVGIVAVVMILMIGFSILLCFGGALFYAAVSTLAFAGPHDVPLA